MIRPRNRYTAAAVLVLLVAGVAVYFFLKQRVPTGPKDLLAYLPPREAAVAFLDVKALRDAGILSKLAGATVGEESEYRALVERTGFDYKRDLDRVAMSSAGGLHYFVVQGRFDWKKLEDYAGASGGACRDGACWLKGSTADRVISFRRLAGGLMALASGRDESAVHAIAARQTPPTFDIPVEPLWIYAPAQTLRSFSSLPPGTALFAKALESAEGAMFTLGPDAGEFRLGLDVKCRTAEEAAVLRTQLQSVTTLLTKLITRENQAPNPDDLGGVLTAGVFERQNNRVVGKWPIRRAFLDSLGGS